MKATVLKFGLSIILFCSCYMVTAQQSKLPLDDQLLQQEIYKENKKKVQNYSLKEFDALFMEFFQRKLDTQVLLTKEEFYTYTVKIATFSDRLASLYPEQQQTAEENKKKWMSENYQDYLVFKSTQKK
ncbi:hypothetical protein [Flavobacterium agrisoli]|uniref:Uncharacterized protein n=1 Tax=Flavobacterium agrisoli TaxID=2793066 RepID=A0A934PNJ8_9FLAO|nr:hypothetical protein [Flavobacterium agrisoli]MBK0370554.1 hypothetical protein [Flavobacterium agrisoli]